MLRIALKLGGETEEIILGETILAGETGAQEERQTNKHKKPICRLMYQSIFDVFLSFFNTELENECCFGLIVLTVNFRNNYAQT